MGHRTGATQAVCRSPEAPPTAHDTPIRANRVLTVLVAAAHVPAHGTLIDIWVGGRVRLIHKFIHNV